MGWTDPSNNEAYMAGKLVSTNNGASLYYAMVKKKHPLADKYAQVTADVARQRGATMVVGAASTFSKDILPRAADLSALVFLLTHRRSPRSRPCSACDSSCLGR